MPSGCKPTEYIFILPDGSKRFEMVYESHEVHVFHKMHGAVQSMPLRHYEAQEQSHRLGA